MTFKAILLQKSEEGVSCSMESLPESQLFKQEGDTLIQVHYSSINYKDALALTHKSPVVRLWPMIPGIDGVGTVIECQTGQYQPGDHVILNGWGCGETHWGCLAERAYLKSDWLIPLPAALTPYQAMAIGTAGYTAGLCVERIMNHGITPEQGSVLVTGASGGVGSVAVALLAKLGYHVTAATSKIEQTGYLQKLGAVDFIDSSSLTRAGKPLQKEHWSAAVDTLGSHALANVCAQTQYGGIIAACGLAQGLDFPSTVAPFILRAVTLAGIDSVMVPYETRIAAWDKLALWLDHKKLAHIAKTISLNECADIATQMLSGKIKGRFVVDVTI